MVGWDGLGWLRLGWEGCRQPKLEGEVLLMNRRMAVPAKNWFGLKM